MELTIAKVKMQNTRKIKALKNFTLSGLFNLKKSVIPPQVFL